MNHPKKGRSNSIGYMHIENLYRPAAQVILMFRECWALEKIHGTSAHVSFKYTELGWSVTFFSGGESHPKFVALFDQEKLLIAVKDLGIPIDKEITIYGEAYGGKQQGMSTTYGKELKFIVFDVQIGDTWLSVPDAGDVAKKLGLEFVHYVKCSLMKLEYPKDAEGKTIWGEENLTIVTNLSEIDVQRDAPSIQAVRNGCSTPEAFARGEGPKREGVVLRPLVEMTLNNGSRVICKHKGDAFKETATPRPVVDPAQMKVLDDANAIANEWVTVMRLQHVLDKIPKSPNSMGTIPQIIKAMQEDVLREAEGEIVVTEMVKKAIGKKAVELYKQHLNGLIK